jgi:DNA-binding response OmpR family regulator
MNKILIVDDEPDLLRMVSLVLELEKFETLTAGSKDQAVSILNVLFPDLIILDINISGHDGREFCKELKARSEFKDIPILLFSADSTALADFELYQADAVIEKPFDILELTDIVKSLILKAKQGA